VTCIPINPAHVESQESLWEKYRRLQQTSAAGKPAAPGGA